MVRPCIVVAGQGRCGTSIMMQMLSAAGVPCIGDSPDFEDDSMMVGRFDRRLFEVLNECAVKTIDPANLPIGNMPNHIIVWFDRNAKEQAKSQAKLLGAMGYSLGRSDIRKIASSLSRDRSKHRARLGVIGGCPAISLSFEDLIDPNSRAIPRLSVFLLENGWRLNLETMQSIIIPRGPECLPFLLEGQLLARRHPVSGESE